MGKASTRSKDKYNKKTYVNFMLRVRRDSELCDELDRFKAMDGTSLNYLVTRLLEEHFLKGKDQSGYAAKTRKVVKKNDA